MKQKLGRYFLLEPSFLRTLLAIAVPIALQNMISFGVSVMDSVMLGSFGDVAIAAANLGSQPFFILMSFGFGLSSGGTVLIAQYWGKGDLVRIRKVMRISMQLVFLASLVISTVCLLAPQGILRIFTTEEEIIRAGAGYLSLVVFSYIPYSISYNYMMSLRAVEQVKISTVIYAVSFFVNVFFNYAFIFGKFGAPRLEVRGAAVGTVFARCSELLMVLIYMYAKERTVCFRIHDCLKFDREMLPGFARHSLPVLGNELLWGVGTTATSVIIGRIGSVFVAANSIAGVMNQMMFITVAGVANAAAVITGKTIGAGNRGRVQRVANTLLLVSVALGVFNCLLILALRPLFLTLYSVTPETYAAAWSILGVLAALQLVIGVDVTTIVGILRGGGDTRSAFLYDCGALWFVSLPMGILSGLVLHWPVPLVYVCLKLDSPIKALLALLRIRSGKWVRNVTVQTAPLAEAE